MATYKLGDLIKIKHGYAFKGDYISTEDNGVVLVTPGNFNIGGGFKEDKCKFFVSNYPDEYVLKPYDLIVSMTDLSKMVDTLGYSALVPNSKRVYLHNQRIGLVEIVNDSICKEYLYWLMRSPNYQKTIASTSTGSTVHHTSPNRICEYEFELPKKATQKRIASILDSIDEKIKENKAINDNLEQQAFAIFDKYFPDVSIGDNSIGDYIIPKRGKNLLSKDAVCGDVPVVAGGLEPATYHNKANTSSPVLTISASGANSGFVRLWDIPVWSSDSSYIDSSMTSEVYFWYVMLKKRQKEIYDSQTGSAQPHIYPRHIAVMSVAELKKDNILQFTKQVTPLFQMIGSNFKENRNLANLRDTLLPKLMSGEPDVFDIDL